MSNLFNDKFKLRKVKAFILLNKLLQKKISMYNRQNDLEPSKIRKTELKNYFISIVLISLWTMWGLLCLGGASHSLMTQTSVGHSSKKVQCILIIELLYSSYLLNFFFHKATARHKQTHKYCNPYIQQINKRK